MRKLTFIVVLFCTTMSASRAGNLRYSVPANPWPEHFGNHRAVVRIAHPASAVHIRLPWRRHDPDPELRHLLVVEASAGDTLANIRRTQVTNEVCDIVVGPVNRRGLYFLYYLPYTVQSGWGFFGGSYLPPESPPDSSWV